MQKLKDAHQSLLKIIAHYKDNHIDVEDLMQVAYQIDNYVADVESEPQTITFTYPDSDGGDDHVGTYTLDTLPEVLSNMMTKNLKLDDELRELRKKIRQVDEIINHEE